MDNYDVFLNLVVIFAGVYCIYVWYVQKIGKLLVKKDMFIPNGANAENCKDINGYLNETSTKILIMGLVSIGFGIFDMFACETKYISLWIQYTLIAAYILFLFGFSYIFKRIGTKYWPDL